MFLLRGNNKARVFLRVFYDEVFFNFVVKSSLINEEITRSMFLLRGNNKTRVFVTTK